MPSPSEILLPAVQAAEELYQAEVGTSRDAQANATRFAQELAQREQDLAACQEREAALLRRVAALEAELADMSPVPPPAENFIVRETFQAPLDPKKWIFLCHNPAKNFVWTEPGSLDVIFEAGRTTGTAIDSASGKVERSEFELRKSGEPADSGVPEGLPVGKEYVIVHDITIPPDYDPNVSSAPNERRNLCQLWEHKDFSPFAVEMIKPSLPPWDGKTNVLRIMAAGAVRWAKPVEVGKRYRLWFQVLLHKTAGKLLVSLNGEEFPAYIGPTCHGAAPQMVPHWGLYLPGSDNDPVGSKTRIRLHEISIKPI